MLQNGTKTTIPFKSFCLQYQCVLNKTSTRQSFTRTEIPIRNTKLRRIFLQCSTTNETPKIEKDENSTKNILLPAGSLILVIGATGGVGQLTVKRLLDLGYRVRATARDLAKADSVLEKSNPNLEIVKCDFRFTEEIPPVMENVDAVVSVLGTSAFPSERWRGDNGPDKTDRDAFVNLLANTPKTTKRFIMISSMGVDRADQFPYLILNAYKTLTYKKMAEDKLKNSGLSWTIFRPGRLTDAPYTSMDLNTLIRGTRGDRTSIEISGKDDLSGETSRIAVAEAIVQSLNDDKTFGKAYSIQSVEGDDPPEQDEEKWSRLFESV